MRALQSIALVGAFALTTAAQAVSIAGLVNTGAGLSAGQADTRYSFQALSGTATSPSGFGYVTSNASYPFPYWLGNSASSSWLTPTPTQSQSYDPVTSGLYRWTLSFDLTGYDASSASFSGRWAADNSGVLLLNGVQIATASTLTTWNNIATVNSGFLPGVNTLTFMVTNNGGNVGGNPTGLRAEFLSNVNVTAVPEPGAAWLMLAGLGGMGLLLRRRLAR